MGSRNSKGRMLYWKISYSKQLVRCSIFSKLLFTWLIPNTDDLGRMEGEPEIIKGMVFPLDSKISIKMIIESLEELSDEGLIIWYQVNENWYIEFPNFHEYQKLRKDREYKSDYPAPSDIDMTCLDKSGHGLREVKVSEGEGKEKVSDDEKKYTPEFEKFYSIYPNPFNKEQTFKNWKNCLKTETVENIIFATNSYLKYLKDSKTDKQYFVRSTNFLGQKQEYKGYLEYKPIKPVEPIDHKSKIVFLDRE